MNFNVKVSTDEKFNTLISKVSEVYARGRDNFINALTNGGKDFYRFFQGIKNLESLPYIDTSNGVYFTEMFADCTSLKTIPGIDTSKAVECISMFRNCESLITIPYINTSKVYNFDSMFSKCYALINLPEIDTSNGSNFNATFAYCYELVTIPKLNLSKGTNLGYMFYQCNSLENIIFEGYIKNDLSLSHSKKLTVDSLMSAINALYDFSGTTTAKTLTIGEINLAKLTEEQKTIATDKGWVLA